MDETDTAKFVYSNMESPLGIGSFKFIIKDSQPMVMTLNTHLFLTKEKAIYCKKKYVKIMNILITLKQTILKNLSGLNNLVYFALSLMTKK